MLVVSQEVERLCRYISYICRQLLSVITEFQYKFPADYHFSAIYSIIPSREFFVLLLRYLAGSFFQCFKLGRQHVNTVSARNAWYLERRNRINEKKYLSPTKNCLSWSRQSRISPNPPRSRSVNDKYCMKFKVKEFRCLLKPRRLDENHPSFTYQAFVFISQLIVFFIGLPGFTDCTGSLTVACSLSENSLSSSFSLLCIFYSLFEKK